MINGKRVLVVVPAWNEEECIAEVVREVRGELPGAGVLVVDDGSSDGTAALAADAGATVTQLPYNLGVGAALRAGYRYGFEHGSDIVVQVDGDGQHDPREVPRLVDALDEADFVIGARFAGEGDYTVRGPRRWAMTMLSAVLSRLGRTRLTDTTSGFRAANRRTVALLAHWYPVEYLGDTIEVLVRLLRNGYQVRQVPVTMRSRIAGTPSQSAIKSTIYLCRAFLVLLLSMLRR